MWWVCNIYAENMLQVLNPLHLTSALQVAVGMQSSPFFTKTIFRGYADMRRRDTHL